ncbi:synaptonemal complex protein ZEP1-like isoform X2 [Asparagus officinalis]|uniref:synaptonemal complex protein ZEP1-like isoform X2 n=1 Tax=Asparagus officinalis TaxID=4686 RepID=UPI00098E514C|nr:synaptonemal complex protein ZEP1-like isoform X2 [Asparagus officinalis]
MQKLGFPALKSLEHFRSLKTPLSGAGKATPKATTIVIPSTPPVDSINYGSFATLKRTAEKLIQEQASVKTDLELAHKKLIKATEQIHKLEDKVQEEINENSRLRAKQTEDEKNWKGIDSKISSTNALCDQLTETLEQLTDQTRTAEEGRKFFEEKILDNSKELEKLNSQLNDLAAKLESAGNAIRTGEEKIMELRHEKEEMEKKITDEQCTSGNIIKGKDALIRQLENATEENKRHLQTVDCQLHEVQQDLILKEETCNRLRSSEEVLRKEKCDLECNNQDLILQVDKSLQEIKHLEDLVCGLMSKVVDLDKESLTVSNYVTKMVSSFETFCELAQQEKNLALKCAQGNFDKLHGQFLGIRSENDALRAEIGDLKEKIMELQKSQEFTMVQHAEECRLVEDKTRTLESEVEVLVSKKTESEKLVVDLKERVKVLTEASGVTEDHMQDLLQKISKLETENHNLEDKVQSLSQERDAEAGALRDEIMTKDQEVKSLENEISNLRNVLNDKEQVHASFLDKEKVLEEQKAEIHASLIAAEGKLTEERKHFELMLEGKQLELSKHLKELSQRNDQAINEIRRKYEEEKLEIGRVEKEKADKLIKEMERKCDERISEHKEEAQKCLLTVKEEHAALISKIQQEYDQKESNLRAHQKEELQRIQLQAENEMRERTSSLRREHEIQMKSVKLQHDDDCKRLQEELELQRSKEEKQRALLQLQWKVMGESQQDDQEVNSKKEYSVSSIKMKDPYGGKEHRISLTSPESRMKDANLSGLMRTPVANLLKKGNTGNVINIPKHRKKVTRHEYEVETSNGQTVTKRRRTKSTVMFGEPNPHKTARTRTPDASKNVTKMTKVPSRGPQPHPANIGDLFSEGSLNPYADDPYAFD